MNLVLHLVRTDLRRLAVWLLLWAVVLAAMDVLGFVVLASEPELVSATVNPWRDFRSTRDALIAAEALIAFVMVVLLVQGDRLAGTRAFWMTRPVSGAKLLLAKCITALVVLIVIPSVISLPWWLWCGFGVHELGVGVRTFGVEAVAVALPAAFVACLMDTLSRALLWGLMVVSVAVVLFMMALLGAGPAAGALPVFRVPLLAVAVFATFAAVTVAQYGWRRPRVTAIVLGCGVLVCALGRRANVGYLAPFLTHHAAAGAAVQVQLVRATVLPAPGDARVQLITKFGLTAAPRGLLVSGIGISQTWRESDRGRRFGGFSALDSAFWGDLPVSLGFHMARSPRVGQVSALIGGPPADRRQADPPGFVARLALPSDDAAAVTGQPVRYEAELGFSLLKPRVVAEQPLADSGWHAETGRGLRIIGARRIRGEVMCAVITSALDPSFGPYSTVQDREHRLVCAIVDRTADSLLPSIGAHEFGTVSINSVMISCRSFGGGPFGDADYVTVAPIAMVEKARLVRRIQIDKFRPDVSQVP